MTMLYFLLTISCSIFLVHEGSGSIEVKLERCDTIFLPTDFTETDEEFRLNAFAFNTLAYDEDERLAYTAGFNRIQVVDVTDPCNLNAIFRTSVNESFFILDMEVCGDFLIASVSNIFDVEDGRVLIFRKFNRALNQLELVNVVEVGPTPQMVAPTKDCRKIVVTIFGPLLEIPGQNITDPPGFIYILKFKTADLTQTPEIKILDFTDFDPWAEELRASGVRQNFFDNNNLLSNNLGPANVAFNKDETIAYVTLLVNNAIAVVDLVKHRIKDILPLGKKSFRNSKIDTSDRDGGFRLRNWGSISAFRLPRVLSVIHLNGREFIITANEGFQDPPNSIGGPSRNPAPDAIRIGDLELDTNVFPNAADLQADGNLGRLFVSKPDADPDGDGKAERLCAIGSRDLSLVDPWTGNVLVDSGDQVESIVGRERPDLFNAAVLNGLQPSQTVDTLSDGQGAEPAPLAIAKFNGKTVIFVALEDPGFVLSCVIDPEIHPIEFKCGNLYTGIPENVSDVTWDELYNQRLATDLDPVDLRFIPAERNPTGGPILLVGSRRSSTVSALKITIEDEGRTSSSTSTITTPSTPLSTISTTRSPKRRPKFRFPNRKRNGRRGKGRQRGKGCFRRKERKSLRLRRPKQTTFRRW